MNRGAHILGVAHMLGGAHILGVAHMLGGAHILGVLSEVFALTLVLHQLNTNGIFSTAI